MASAAFEDIVADFEFLEDWEERYRYLMEQGKALPAFEDALRAPTTKVEGCASQVWLFPNIEAGIFSFTGDSDALIVRGLIAVLQALYNGVPVDQIAHVDAVSELARLGLKDHLSAQRSNGVRAMVERIAQVTQHHMG
jgi:cysteine desulfuration protein SufE